MKEKHYAALLAGLELSDEEKQEAAAVRLEKTKLYIVNCSELDEARHVCFRLDGKVLVNAVAHDDETYSFTLTAHDVDLEFAAQVLTDLGVDLRKTLAAKK